MENQQTLEAGDAAKATIKFAATASSSRRPAHKLATSSVRMTAPQANNHAQPHTTRAPSMPSPESKRKELACGTFVGYPSCWKVLRSNLVHLRPPALRQPAFICNPLPLNLDTAPTRQDSAPIEDERADQDRQVTDSGARKASTVLGFWHHGNLRTTVVI